MQNPEASENLRLNRSEASIGDPASGFLVRCRGLLDDNRKTRLLLLALFAFSIVVRLNQTINNDVGWYIYTTGAWLDGARLHQEIFYDTNPPLILYLTAPAVYVAELAGLFPAHVYFVYVFALIALSLALCHRVLSCLFPRSRARVSGLILAGFLALVIAPAGDFGQREHLTIILSLPYVALLARRAVGGDYGWPQAVTIGVMAGLGFAMKPYFLIALLGVELYLLLRTHRLGALLRAETMALATTGSLYGVSLILVTPDYLGSVVPYAFEVYNANYRNSLGFVLDRKETLLVPLAVLSYWVTRRQLRQRQLTEAFLLSMVCFVAVYLIQMKGWNYQLYPATAWLIMSLATLIAALPGEDPALSRSASGAGRQILPWQLGILAVIGFMALKPFAIPGNHYPLTNYLLPLVQKYAKDDSIYFFSSNTWTGFPLVNYGEVRWASRFPTLWLLPGLVNDHGGEPERVSARHQAKIERMKHFVIEAMVSDLTRNSPALIMVDARPEKEWYLKSGFDFIAFFSTDPRFRALWSHYEKIEDIGGWQVFRRCEVVRDARPSGFGNFNEFKTCRGELTLR